MIKRLAVFVSIVLSMALVTPASAVTYGSEITDASVSKPWVVSIWWSETNHEGSRKRICSGSLIEAHIVLTAAHCILPNGFYYVQSKTDTLKNESASWHVVDSAWKSPRYSKKDYVNDFGLLKLEEPIIDIVPAELATRSQLKKSDALTNYNLYGWGINQDGEDPTYLGFAKLKNHNKSASKLWKIFNSKTMIAAGRYISTERVYAGACDGDSGGPLTGVINGSEVLVGITSWGLGNCNYKAPSVFTKVAYFAKDIKAGIIAVVKGAVVANRAAPRQLIKPTISGGVAEGQLKCNIGEWSSNATNVTYEWISPYSVSGIKDQPLSVSSYSINRTFICRVTASTGFASVYYDVSKTIPASPLSYTYPSIRNVSFGKTALGTVLSCGPLTWYGTGVSESVNWYASNNLVFSSGASVMVGSGSQLTVTPELISSFSGKDYVHCVVTGTNEGGSKSYDTSKRIIF